MYSSVIRRGCVVLGRRSLHTARPSFAPADPTKSSFQWQHLVTPYTNPEFTARMRSIEQTLQAMKAELSGVPDTIEPIPWSEWEEKVDDKSTIDSIHSSYDNLKLEADKVTDVQQFNSELDKAISTSSASEAVIAELIATYKTELTAAKKEKVDIHTWHFHDYLARYPGLAEQMRAEYMEGYQLPPEALERLADSDLGELKRQVRNGGRLSSDEDIPTKVGDFDYEVELKKTEDLAKKLYGDSPQLKDIQAQIQRELLAVKQLQESHAADDTPHH